MRGTRHHPRPERFFDGYERLIPSLAIFTLIGVVVAAIVGLVLFKRKKANRHPMEQRPDGAIATVDVSADKPPPPTVRATDE